jgi:hypothetical protein
VAPSKPEDVNRLLAQWAELLKVRHEIRSLGMVSYRMIYRASWNAPEQHYDAEFGIYAEGDELHDAFVKNIEQNLDGLEKELKANGVSVSRPA